MRPCAVSMCAQMEAAKVPSSVTPEGRAPVGDPCKTIKSNVARTAWSPEFRTGAMHPIPTFSALGVPVHAVNIDTVVDLLRNSLPRDVKGYVVFRDIHGVVRCQDDPMFLDAHANALLVCPDGMPLVWIGRQRGFKGAGRVYGPDLMRALMAATRDGSATHYLFGGRPGVAETLRASLQQRFTGVRIVGTYTPPFGPMSGEEFVALRDEVARVKPDFFWVGLSTPKQELFMADHLTMLDTKIMLGVGAAFDYLSGQVHEPPSWIRNSGLQWFARMVSEPRRLAGRYLATVPRFLFLYGLESARRLRRTV